MFRFAYNSNYNSMADSEILAFLKQENTPTPPPAAPLEGSNANEPPSTETVETPIAVTTPESENPQNTQQEAQPQEKVVERFKPLSYNGREFKNEEEILGYLKEADNRQPEIDNPLIKSALEYVKGGGDIDTWYASQRADFDTLAKDNPDEVLFRHAKLNDNAGLSDEEIRLLLNDKYKTDSDEYPELTETEIRLNQIAKKRDTAEASKALKEWQVKEKTPKAVREAQDLNKRFLDNTSASVAEAMKTSEIKVGDYSHKIEWDSEGLKDVKKALESPVDWINNNLFLRDAQGNAIGVNAQRLGDLLLRDAQLNVIAQSVADQKVAKEIKEIKDNVTNPTTKPRQGEFVQTKIDEDIQKILALKKGKR